jgi:polar amino acid transport system substrate-binding protein
MKLSKILLIGGLLYLTMASAAANEIELLTAPYPPFHGPNLRNQGPLTEIVVEAYKKVGYRVAVKFLPWARALKLAKEGKADGLHGAWYAAEREQWFVYSQRLPGSEVVFYKRKGTGPQTFTSYEALRPYTIGIVRGYRNPPAFDAANLHTAVTDSDKTNLRILAAKRVNLILIDRYTARSILETELPEHRDHLEALEPAVEALSLYLLISKKAADYQTKVDDFNKGLERLRVEDGIERIMKEHGLW